MRLADLLLTKLQVVASTRRTCATSSRCWATTASAPRHRLGRIPTSPAATGGSSTRSTARSSPPGAPPESRLPADGRQRIAARADELDDRARTPRPKTAKWRMRARVGERMRWYEEPEEARA